jgi:hypothetical protein
MCIAITEELRQTTVRPRPNHGLPWCYTCWRWKRRPFSATNDPPPSPCLPLVSSPTTASSLPYLSLPCMLDEENEPQAVGFPSNPMARSPAYPFVISGGPHLSVSDFFFLPCTRDELTGRPTRFSGPCSFQSI